jgi:hypothetical protein
MKFPQLPIGARFEFEGKTYVKTGPIAATGEEGGQRMIPRWADLRVQDGTVPLEPPRPKMRLEEEAVRQALEAHGRECDRVLEEAVEDDARLEAARARMALSRARFLAALGLHETDKN